MKGRTKHKMMVSVFYAITVERANSFYHFLSPSIGVRAATEPAGEKMHLRASLSHCETVIMSANEGNKKYLKIVNKCVLTDSEYPITHQHAKST
jgi:hypothetical protein